MDQQGGAQVAHDRRRAGRLLRRVRRDTGVQRLARADGPVQRAHGLLQRRVRVGAVVVEDVDVLQAHPPQGLVEAGGEVLARAEVAVGAVPHRPTGLGGDDELVAVRPQVLGHDPAEVDLRAAGGRAVVVGEVDVADTQVECPPQDRPLGLQGPVVAEVVPQAEGDRRQVEAAASTAAVVHGLVAVG